jgi:hypothetical protein
MITRRRPSRRTLVACVLATAAATVWALPSARAVSTTTVSPTADAFVNSSRPDGNFGTGSRLEVRSGTRNRLTFIRFDGAAGTPTAIAILLQIHPTATPSAAISLSTSAAAWDERTITWNNAPVQSRALVSGELGTDGWLSFDVTDLAIGGATSFVIGASPGFSDAFNARESGSTYAPRLVVTSPDAPTTSSSAAPTTSSSAPPAGGFFGLQDLGSWSSLPSGSTCASLVHRSTWEPRTDNTKRNHIVPNANAVHQGFKARPLDTSSYNPLWSSWLLPRVDGQFTGTTDEIFQWAACKWGLPDNVLRGIAVRESTWYQYETYPNNRPVTDYGNGDYFSTASTASQAFCNTIDTFGYSYQSIFGPGLCPKTFSIVGIMSWQDPSWGPMLNNQNGTFPFSRDSTAFAVDYLGSYLRGCYEGFVNWLAGPGDLWGCVGSWYAGDWHSSAANGYISRVQNEINNLTWLQSGWPSNRPSCSPTYGCPGPDKL